MTSGGAKWSSWTKGPSGDPGGTCWTQIHQALDRASGDGVSSPKGELPGGRTRSELLNPPREARGSWAWWSPALLNPIKTSQAF